MKVKVNNCVDCGKPCLLHCPVRDDAYEYRCDDCGKEEQLYDFECKELCLNCIEKRLDKIN